MKKLFRTIFFLSLIGTALFIFIKSPAIEFCQNIITKPFYWIHEKKSQFVSLDEVEALKAELNQFKKDQLLNSELKNENERLKNLLELKQTSAFSVIAASVVGRDPNHWFRTVSINKGTDEGLQANMPVIHSKGLIGFIVEAAPHSSRVQLITDYNCKVGALVESSRESGILKGEGEQGCLLDYLPRETSVKVGDQVITSGLGNIYPKGIFIGVVESVRIKKGGLYQSAVVKPSVQFNSLEEVMVITQKE